MMAGGIILVGILLMMSVIAGGLLERARASAWLFWILGLATGAIGSAIVTAFFFLRLA